MAPEALKMRHNTILDEACEIRDTLMPLQQSVSEAGHNELERHLSEVRERLGYEPAAAVDVDDLVDTRIVSKTPVISPELVSKAIPLTPGSAETTRRGRIESGDILLNKDDRLMVIAGPCSIHNPEEALEYAQQLALLQERYGSDLQIIMRTYFEKPRTNLGWKGFAYDPELDNGHDINLGLIASRLLMTQLTLLGMPTATERLNAQTPQYLNGLVVYDAIGARNTTDQKQREYASGSSSPVGFKNTPEGSIVNAIDAIRSANAKHTFLGLHPNGTLMEVETTGNPLAHVILRGSNQGPNYSAPQVEATVKHLQSAGVLEAIVVDASHGNSQKDHRRQIAVVKSVATQVAGGQQALKGVMIESYLQPGNQKLDETHPDRLLPGISITDACVGIEETAEMFDILAASVRERRKTIGSRTDS